MALNRDIYILCPAEVSAACLGMPKLTLIFTDVEGRAAVQKGMSVFQLTGDGFIFKKSTSSVLFVISFLLSTQ